MSRIVEAATKQSKRTAAHISKFHYHLQYTVPQLFPSELKKKSSFCSGPILRTKKGLRNTTFHFAQHEAEGVESLDSQAILLSALKIYVDSECVKLTDCSYRRSKIIKAPYLPFYGHFQEILQFYIVDHNEETQILDVSQWVKASGGKKKDRKQSESEIGYSKKDIKRKAKNFELYVIHHCHVQNQDHMKWQNFIQKYHFREEGEQFKSKIYYHLVFNYQENQGFLNYITSKDKLFQIYLHQHLAENNGELKNVNLFQGYLLQSQDRVAQKIKELNDPAFDESQKKWLKLSPQYFKMFTHLRKHAMIQHRQLHKEKEHLSDIALSSLAYRYMVAKEYNYKECYEHIIEYMKWQKHLCETYDLILFQRFHKLDFYTFLGHDYEGRCVILNKAAHLVIDKIDSVEDYCNYFCYFLEVFVPRKLKGYAEQYTVLADLEGLSTDNYKFAITKQNIADGLKYCPERQYKFLALNAGSFAKTLWMVFKTIIPAKTLAKINIVGQDKTEILDVLLAEMDLAVIPEYLGGSNRRTFEDDLHDQKIYLQQRTPLKRSFKS